MGSEQDVEQDAAPNGARIGKRTTADAAVRAGLKFGFVVLLIVMAMVLAAELAGSDIAKEIADTYGYYGVFVLSVVSGFNLIVPIPAVTLMPVFAVIGLGFWPTITTIVAGMTVADILAFLIGTTSRQFFESRSQSVAVLDKLRRLREKNERIPLVVMFIFASLAPLPNEVLVIPLGLMGYRIRDILIPVVAGNFIFNYLAANALLGTFSAL